MADDHSAFVGKWQHVKSEHLDEYLAANGVNWVARKMMSKSNPTAEITINGDQITIRIVTLVITRDESITVGTPYEEKQVDGTLSVASARWEDGKLVIEYKPKVEGQGNAQKVTREIANGQLVMTFEVGGVVMKRWFDKAT